MHQGCLAEHSPDRFAQRLAAVQDEQDRLRGIQAAPLCQRPVRRSPSRNLWTLRARTENVGHVERAEAELVKARKVIEIRGNLSALLEQMLDTESASGSGSTGR
jgi:hypothetical protein